MTSDPLSQLARIVAFLPTDDRPVVQLGRYRATADPPVGALVAFSPPGAPAWVGNFPGDAAGALASHPDGTHVVIVAGGPAYIVDPVSRALVATVGDFFWDVLPVPGHSLLVFNSCGTNFEAYASDGRRWRTRRVSWDGIQKMRVVGEHVEADTWHAPTQRWVPVTVDVVTGHAQGGAWDMDDD